MADIKHIDLDDETFEDAPKALRDYAAKLKKALDDQTKRADGLAQKVAATALSDVLGKQGFKNPSRVQKDILRDGIDPLDTEAVEEWLADNSDDYAKGEAAPAAEAEQVQSPVPTEQQAALQQMQSVQSASTNPANLSKWELVQAQITPEMTGDDVIALYAKHGI